MKKFFFVLDTQGHVKEGFNTLPSIITYDDTTGKITVLKSGRWKIYFGGYSQSGILASPASVSIYSDTQLLKTAYALTNYNFGVNFVFPIPSGSTIYFQLQNCTPVTSLFASLEYVSLYYVQY